VHRQLLLPSRLITTSYPLRQLKQSVDNLLLQPALFHTQSAVSSGEDLRRCGG